MWAYFLHSACREGGFGGCDYGKMEEPIHNYMKASVRLWSASNQLKALVVHMSDSVIHQINNYPVDMFEGNQKVFKQLCSGTDTSSSFSMWDVPLLFTAGASFSKGGVYNALVKSS